MTPCPARPRLITLTLLTALSALTLNMILPSLPSMARDLAARESVTALAVSGYMLASAAFQLGLGPLSDRFGRRPVMLGALMIFVAASLGCMLAQDASVLLACRVLLLSGRAVSVAAVAGALAMFAAGVSHPLALFGLTLFVGLGNGLTLPTANAGTMSIHPALAGTAAGLSRALSMALGTVLSTFTAVVVEPSATPSALLAISMGCVLLSLAAGLVAIRAGLVAIRLERQEQPGSA